MNSKSLPVNDWVVVVVLAASVVVSMLDWHLLWPLTQLRQLSSTSSVRQSWKSKQLAFSRPSYRAKENHRQLKVDLQSCKHSSAVSTASLWMTFPTQIPSNQHWGSCGTHSGIGQGSLITLFAFVDLVFAKLKNQFESVGNSQDKVLKCCIWIVYG